MEATELRDLQARARSIRERILRSIHHAQTGHAGPSLSMVELLTIIYFKYLRYDPRNPRDPDRDYFILSKGHGAPGLYATLAEAGIMDPAELLTLRRLDSRLQGHPSAHTLPGVDLCTGSLGQGLSLALGLALGWRARSRGNRVYCILGDGELQEGQNWEAAMAAAAYGASAITVLVDRNRLQGDGDTEQVLALGDLAAKWRAFGWETFEVDGHDLEQIDRAIATGQRQETRPAAIVAHTVKGKGVSYMENVTHWHHHPINDRELEIALEEVLAGA